MHRARAVIGAILLLGSACAPSWRAKTLVDGRKVARALHDLAEVGPAFDPAAVPDLPAPKRLRPCCAFGQDLKARLGPIPVPIYENENIVSPGDIGPHSYDAGALAGERNGLVYTCRGGFVDIAHVRENADRTLYLALQFVRALPGRVALELPEEGALRHVVVEPLPPGTLALHGRWQVAIALARWTNYQLSLWHEIITWYGWQSTPGFSEKLSSFTPEDLYSNALGTNIAAGLVEDLEIGSREEYERSATAWIRESLRRLGAVPKQQARQAMHAVDGLWWDSSKRLPDWKLITRRELDIGSPVSPWLVADALPPDRVPPEIRQMCADQPPPLPLRIPEKLADRPIAELVALRFEFSSWLPERFPLPAGKGAIVTPADFPTIVEDIRREAARELGPEFDVPSARPDETPRVAALTP